MHDIIVEIRAIEENKIWYFEHW